jgi:hypothetical protein
MNWRPLRREKLEPWFDTMSRKQSGCDAQGWAGRLVVKHLGHLPIAPAYANDRDHAWW